LPIARRRAPRADIEDATVRYLMYGLIPAWVIPAAADWALHRRARIESTAGVRHTRRPPYGTCERPSKPGRPVGVLE